MFRSILIFSFFVLTSAGLWAQSLYMPRDIKKAYSKGTRSANGLPGKNYWQNRGIYTISIKVNPPDRNVKGYEQIIYLNNSPDTLKDLNMKLIMNIHRPGAERYNSEDSDYLTEGMQIDTFKINGQRQKWDNADASETNKLVQLQQPLVPHDSLKLNINWHYQLSKKSGREGVIDSNTFYLAYFYPRVSVYDDYNGWDKLQFNDRQEFYNDFNDYLIKVTVPANYIVWATGTLQNPDDILQPEYAKKLKRSMTSDSVINIATPKDIAKKRITVQKENAWIWKANDISDMAVGISNHYNWDAASVIVDDIKNRRASIQAAYNDTASDFHHSVQFSHYALGWFAHNWPGVPYPFPKMTAFQGYADMEFPMMVNDSHQDDLEFSQLVQDHEIAHTYFPFYMGINESRYAFMDEGWATTWELLIGRTEHGFKKADDFYKKFRVEKYTHDLSTAVDLPIITPSSELRASYSINSYGKPSLSYLALKDLLGDDLFKKALHFYMDKWHGKHPIPWDYFNCMSNGSGRNLDWFFNNWFFSNNYIDLKLVNTMKVNNGYKIYVNNTGGFCYTI